MLKRVSFDNQRLHKIVRVCMRGVIAWSPVNAANLGLKGVCAFTSNLHFILGRCSLTKATYKKEHVLCKSVLMSEKCETVHAHTPPTHVSPHVIKPASDLVKLH